MLDGPMAPTSTWLATRPSGPASEAIDGSWTPLWRGDESGPGTPVRRLQDTCVQPQRFAWEALEKLKGAGEKTLKGAGHPDQGVKLGTQLAYFTEVERVEAGNCQKLMLRAMAEQLAVQAYFEALSGFSVVVSELMLKRQLALLGRHDVRLSFVRVANVQDLLQEANLGSGSHVDGAANVASSDEREGCRHGFCLLLISYVDAQ
ncbi:hypothetical protein VTI28DRAFT_8830 [Corynascus sepedonium]